METREDIEREEAKHDEYLEAKAVYICFGCEAYMYDDVEYCRNCLDTMPKEDNDNAQNNL